jgi:hypothetical protein
MFIIIMLLIPRAAELSFYLITCRSIYFMVQGNGGFSSCNLKQVKSYYLLLVGRDNVVGIATWYELEGSGIDTRWGQDFPLLSRPALDPSQSPIQWVSGIFTGGKAAGACR